MTNDNVDATPTDETGAPSVEETPQYGVGPFSIREVALAGVWLVAFVLSFFPISTLAGPQGALFGGANVWVSGLSWILTIGLPTAALFLLVLRRLSPQGIRRVGSLGIDQFASVAFSVSLLVWLTWIWETVALAIQFGAWARSWVIWVEAVLMLAGVVLTVLAPLLPVLREDFAGRPEEVAHRNARRVRAISPRPVRERPAQQPAPAAQPAESSAPAATGAQPYVDTAYAPAADTDDTVTSPTDVFAPLQADSGPIAAEPEWAAADDTIRAEPAASQQPAPAAFWALVPEERDVVDDYGVPLFRVGPTAWALVIEDRDGVFVVRHEDGRIGYLHDTAGVTRG